MDDFLYLRCGDAIAVLQDPAQLSAYEAAGWEKIAADTYHDLWREKAIWEKVQSEQRAAQQARQAIEAAWAERCPACKSTQVLHPDGSSPWCQSCKARAW